MTLKQHWNTEENCRIMWTRDKSTQSLQFHIAKVFYWMVSLIQIILGISLFWPNILISIVSGLGRWQLWCQCQWQGKCLSQATNQNTELILIDQSEHCIQSRDQSEPVNDPCVLPHILMKCDPGSWHKHPSLIKQNNRMEPAEMIKSEEA